LADLDDRAKNASFSKATGGTVRFLFEPERRAHPSTLLWADDRIVEASSTFEGPPKDADLAPAVVDHGRVEFRVVAGTEFSNVGVNAVAGRPSEEYGFEQPRLEAMRLGAWDIRARIDDLDPNGIHTALNVPSVLPRCASQ